jgi:hypothetical protein
MGAFIEMFSVLLLQYFTSRYFRLCFPADEAYKCIHLAVIAQFRIKQLVSSVRYLHTMILWI